MTRRKKRERKSREVFSM